jgi:hypothetical protein
MGLLGGCRRGGTTSCGPALSPLRVVAVLAGLADASFTERGLLVAPFAGPFGRDHVDDVGLGLDGPWRLRAVRSLRKLLVDEFGGETRELAVDAIADEIADALLEFRSASCDRVADGALDTFQERRLLDYCHDRILTPVPVPVDIAYRLVTSTAQNRVRFMRRTATAALRGIVDRGLLVTSRLSTGAVRRSWCLGVVLAEA